MKYLKILGLAAIATMAVMAFVGAGSASATVICKTTSTPCGSLASEIDASLSGTASFEAEGIVIETCTGGTLKGNIADQGATKTAGVSVTTANSTWNGCTKTKTTNEGGTLEFHWIAGTDNATVTARGFVWTVNTIFGSCSYGFGATSTDLGTLIGGAPATLAVNITLPRIAGPCPATETWKASYTFTTPNPLYVREG